MKMARTLSSFISSSYWNVIFFFKKWVYGIKFLEIPVILPYHILLLALLNFYFSLTPNCIFHLWNHSSYVINSYWLLWLTLLHVLGSLLKCRCQAGFPLGFSALNLSFLCHCYYITWKLVKEFSSDQRHCRILSLNAKHLAWRLLKDFPWKPRQIFFYSPSGCAWLWLSTTSYAL